MPLNQRFKYDETKFKPNQREAGIEMVEYEFASSKDRKTLKQIAEDVGVTRRTLHNWNKHDPNFIAYKNHLSGVFLDSHLAFVYGKLLDGIGSGSMKGIEMFMKRIGDLDNRSEVTVHNTGDDLTQEERLEALKARLDEEKDKLD